MTTYELTEKISVLSLGVAGTTYTWGVDGSAWANAEKTGKTNIFSKVGLGATTVKFTLRNRTLTLNHALRWNEQHCFLTDIKKTDDRRYLEVTAALADPVTCAVSRTTTTTDPTYKRPVVTDTSTLTFPGVLTEKYLGRVQDEHMAVNEITYVLVTPKVISLEAGEVVSIDGESYSVVLCHTLDEYKNEYEITRKADV